MSTSSNDIIIRIPKCVLNFGLISAAAAVGLYKLIECVKKHQAKNSTKAIGDSNYVETIKSEEFLKIFTEYGKKFNQSGVLE